MFRGDAKAIEWALFLEGAKVLEGSAGDGGALMLVFKKGALILLVLEGRWC